MAAKKIDPRYDPAFQRGYAAGSDGDGATRSGATRPGATQAASTHVASGEEVYRDAATGYGQAESTIPRQASFASVAPRENAETPHAPAPQSHYVEHDGSLAEIGPGVTHVSLARNPWLYVLWVLAGAMQAGDSLACGGVSTVFIAAVAWMKMPG